MKKKIYEAPVTEFVNVDIDAVMGNTSPVTPTPGGGDSGNGDDEEQMSNEHHGGSWNDIWGGM